MRHQQRLAEARGRELRTISERVSFYSEFHVNSELRLEKASSEFNRAFSHSRKEPGCCSCCGVGQLLQSRMDSEMLRSEQCSLKVLQIALCLLSLLLCPFTAGLYGERGICLAISAGALMLVSTILVVKLLTLNRWLTPQHWFIMEAAVYATLCLLFCLAALAMALLNVPRHLLTGGGEVAATNERQSLALVVALVLALCAASFAVDVGCVYSQRLSRTWIPFVSKYRI